MSYHYQIKLPTRSVYIQPNGTITEQRPQSEEELYLGRLKSTNRELKKHISKVENALRTANEETEFYSKMYTEAKSNPLSTRIKYLREQVKVAATFEDEDFNPAISKAIVEIDLLKEIINKLHGI